MKYCIDFDRTLFDTDAFVSRVVADGYRTSLITADIWQRYRTRDFLYPDALSFLERRGPHSVAIVTAVTTSYGPEALSYQQAKVEQEPVRSLVGEVFYVDGDKVGTVSLVAARASRNGERTVFIDDRFDECEAVYRAVPGVVSICIRRQGNDPLPHRAGIHCIQTLSAVDAIISAL